MVGLGPVLSEQLRVPLDRRWPVPVSEGLFEQQHPEEKAYWLPHNYEIFSGQLVAPRFPTAVEKELLRLLVNSYGKILHTWYTSRHDREGEGARFPTGDAALMWSFNRDGESDPQMRPHRNVTMQIDSQQNRRERRELVNEGPPTVWGRCPQRCIPGGGGAPARGAGSPSLIGKRVYMTESASSLDTENTSEKTELAEDRTDWAYERTLLANDRTYSAWVRTGLTTVAAGFGVTRLLTEVQPAWLVPSLGVLFVLVGGGIFFVAYWTHQQTLRKFSDDESRQITGWIIGGITAALGLGAIASLWLIT